MGRTAARYGQALQGTGPGQRGGYPAISQSAMERRGTVQRPAPPLPSVVYTMVRWVRPVGQVADDRCSDHTVPYTLQSHEVSVLCLRWFVLGSSLDKGVLLWLTTTVHVWRSGACQFNMRSDGLLLQRNRWATLH